MNGQRSTSLRVQHYYGEILADFRRRQADIAAEYAAKSPRRLPPGQAPPAQTPPRQVERSAVSLDQDDFSNKTWLH